ncbi:MAG TPA: hypothetical protein VGF03_04350 [Bryobacteraceae bacterium]|jgi:hypothetical protein
MKTRQEAAVYFVFVLRACGDADSELLKICPETPEAKKGMHASLAKLKANWGTDNPPRTWSTGGDTLED